MVIGTHVSTEVLDVNLSDGILTLTLNRPSALNALNIALKSALAAAFDAATYDDRVRTLLICGAGRAFCAGGDLTEMDPTRLPSESRARQHQALTEVFLPLLRMPKPVIAAVHGHAHGAGLSLALACDVVVVGTAAPLSFGYLQRGLTPDGAITYVLPRLVGMARAKELLFSGRRFTGAEAAEMDLVAVAVDDELVAAEARKRANHLASGPTVALALTKRILDQATRCGPEDLAELEAYSQAITRATSDHAEGIASFKERRDPSFIGR